jgi:hypothetical protein
MPNGLVADQIKGIVRGYACETHTKVRRGHTGDRPNGHAVFAGDWRTKGNWLITGVKPVEFHVRSIGERDDSGQIIWSLVNHQANAFASRRGELEESFPLTASTSQRLTRKDSNALRPRGKR